jgi:hypothetical protein
MSAVAYRLDSAIPYTNSGLLKDQLGTDFDRVADLPKGQLAAAQETHTFRNDRSAWCDGSSHRNYFAT